MVKCAFCDTLHWTGYVQYPLPAFAGRLEAYAFVLGYMAHR